MDDLMIVCLHETSRFSLVGPSSAGRDSFQGDGGPQRRALQDGGGQDFWGNTPGDSWVDRAAEAFGRARSSGRTARASRRRQAQPQAGEGDLRGHRGSLPGSIEASVLSLDAGSGGAPDSTTVWCKAFGLDGGTILGASGFHAPEADAAGVRARPPSGSFLVGAEVSGHSRTGPPREGGDFLGRRNGCAGRPCGRSLVQSTR